MSKSVTISIATNSIITASKFFGYLVTGSPTLFAETIHSAADVANQVLLKVGEVRAHGGSDALHPFGRGQERFFWALVSAVSVFFVGCGVTVYHGIESLLHPDKLEPFTTLAVGLLIFSLALELYTFRVAWKEIGGWKGLLENRSNTSVVAVLLEDAIAVIGILLTLFIAFTSMVFGPHHVLDASVSIVVGLMLGTMALFLANINRKILIDVGDSALNHEVADFLKRSDISATVCSLVVDVDTFALFIQINEIPPGKLSPQGEAIKEHIRKTLNKTILAVYWKFSQSTENS